MEFKLQRIRSYRINIAMQNNAKSLFDDFPSCKPPFVGVGDFHQHLGLDLLKDRHSIKISDGLAKNDVSFFLVQNSGF